MARSRIMWTAPLATNSDETVPWWGVAACDDRIGDVLARPGGELPIPRAVSICAEPVAPAQWWARPESGNLGGVAATDLNEMIGKTLLVGITYLGTDDRPEHRVEFGGIVRSVHPPVSIERGEDVPFTLPPEPEAFERAQPGEYRLRSSGEVVVNPDFVTTWTVNPPPEGE
jgi:hypothetical protein